MSQQKVDKYKQDKANRKQIMKREKMEKLAWKTGGYLVLLVLVGWIGFSAYGRFTEGQEKQIESYVADTTAVNDYLSSLSEES